MMAERLLKAKELAPLLGVEVGTLLDWWQAGLIPGYRLGGRKGGPIRFRLSEVEATLEGWHENTGMLTDHKKWPGDVATPQARQEGDTP